MGRVKVWRMTARCQVCHTPVRVRNTDAALYLLELAKDSPIISPDTVLQTYACAKVNPMNGRKCNAVVEVRVRHWRTE